MSVECPDQDYVSIEFKKNMSLSIATWTWSDAKFSCTINCHIKNDPSWSRGFRSEGIHGACQNWRHLSGICLQLISAQQKSRREGRIGWDEVSGARVGQSLVQEKSLDSKLGLDEVSGASGRLPAGQSWFGERSPSASARVLDPPKVSHLTQWHLRDRTCPRINMRVNWKLTWK